MSILTGLTLYACPLPATTSLSPAIVFHPNEKYFSSVRRNQSSDPGSGRGQVSPPLPKRLQTRRALELIQSGYLDPHGCCHPIRIKCGESDENKLLTNVILADMFSSFRTVRYAPLMAISNGRPSNGVAVWKMPVNFLPSTNSTWTSVFQKYIHHKAGCCQDEKEYTQFTRSEEGTNKKEKCCTVLCALVRSCWFGNFGSRVSGCGQ